MLPLSALSLSLACSERNPAFRIHAEDRDGGDVGLTPDAAPMDPVDVASVPAETSPDRSDGHPIPSVPDAAGTGVPVPDAAGTASLPLDTAAAGPDWRLDGLVGHWPFDEGAGTVASDLSGNRNHASLRQSASWSASGRVGGALSLDGSGYAVVARSSTLDGITGPFTITAWAQPRTITAEWTMLLSRQFDNALYEHYGVGVIDGNPAATAFGNRVTAATVMEVGRWYHLAYSFDGQMQRLFVNGVQRGAETSNPPMPDTSPLIIGANQNYDVIEEHWVGLVDEVRLYRRALSPDEIAALAGAPP